MTWTKETDQSSTWADISDKIGAVFLIDEVTGAYLVDEVTGATLIDEEGTQTEWTDETDNTTEWS